jgi:type IV secretion system protein VirD4
MTGPLRIVYIAFCLAIGFVVWLLAYGLALQLFYRDGTILRATITSNPFAPVHQLIYYWKSATLHAIALGAALPAAVVAGILGFSGLRPRPSPLGDAKFQSLLSLWWHGWFRRKGKVLGRFGRLILRVDDDRHHLIVGPTRSGKGACYVIPNALTHKGSMIVTDLKGEIFRSTAGYRKSKGNQVFLFAPGSGRTHRYNPLDFIRPDRGDRTTDIQNIAAILVPEVAESENSIWQATAQQVMAGAISYINESVHYQGRRNLGEVTALFNSGVNLQALMILIKEREPYLSRFTVESFNAYIGLSERAAASALLDVHKALKPFRNERVVAATSVTDMDLRALKRRPISIYLAPNINDMTLLRPLLALFVQQTLDILLLEQTKRSVPVYFLLDEFLQLKKMVEITTKLPYVAGYNIKMAFVIQGLKSVDEIYGETSRHSLVGCCAYQLCFGANDEATAESVSKGAGKRTVRFKTESKSMEMMGVPRRTMIEQLRERDLLMPQELRQLPPQEFVILAENQFPVRADRLRYFQTAPFAAMERFSQANLPRVPATEFLPQRPVPAVAPINPSDSTQASADERAPHLSGSVAPILARNSMPKSHECHDLEALTADQGPSEVDKGNGAPQDRPSTQFQKERHSLGSASNDGSILSTVPPFKQEVDNRFDIAARRLKSLVIKGSTGDGARLSSRNWSAIFDETVADDVPT